MGLQSQENGHTTPRSWVKQKSFTSAKGATPNQGSKEAQAAEALRGFYSKSKGVLALGGQSSASYSYVIGWLQEASG